MTNIFEEMKDLIRTGTMINIDNILEPNVKCKELVEIAVLALDCKRFDNAISNLLKADELYPNNPLINFIIGDLYQRLEFRKGSKCINYFKIACEKCNDKEAHYKYPESLILKEKEDFKINEEIVDLLLKSIIRYKNEITNDLENDKLFLFMGISYFYLERYKDSLNSLKRAIELNSKDDQSYFYIGEVYNKLGMIDEAEKSYEKSIKVNEENIFSMYKLAVLNYNKGKYKIASIHLDKAIAIDKNYQDVIELRNINNSS